MTQSQRIVRWIGVLPMAAIGAFLATFPLHWVLYFTLAHGQTISGVNIDPIEYNLTPFVIAISFVLIGYNVAPNRKFKTSIVLSCLWVAIFLSLFLFLPASQTQFGIRGVGSVLGALLGLLIAWKMHRPKSSTTTVSSDV